jgi:hypothetical protein
VWDVNNQLQVQNKGGKHRMPGHSANEIHAGMQVLSSDGRPVGDVKQVRSNDFLLDDGGGQDVFVPLGDCHVADGVVRLHVRSTDVYRQGWETTQAAGAHARH